MKKGSLFFFFLLSVGIYAQSWKYVGSAGFSSDQANYTSLAINETIPYLAFSDLSVSGKTTVMKFTGTDWTTVGIQGFSEGLSDYVNLVFNNNTPYVVFQDWSHNGKASLMKFDGYNWVYVGQPGFSPGEAYYTNLAFNGTTPYVAFMDLLNSSKVTVMKYNGQMWEYVGSPGFSAGKAYYVPIAFNGTTPYVAYRDFGNASKATVMKFDGTNWVSVGTPGFTMGEADYLSLAFNNSIPYLSFEDYGYSLKASVMKFDGQNWVYVGSPGFSDGWTCFTSLAFNGTTPYVAYWDGENSSGESVMKYNGQSWVSVGWPGFSAGKTYFNTMAFNGSTPYVAFQDFANSYKATVMKFDESASETFRLNLISNPIEGGTVRGANIYNSGDQVTVSANENTGYAFLYWSENGNIISYNKIYNFTIYSNRNLVANFLKNQFTVAVSVDPANSGIITGSGIYNYGSTVNLIAAAKSNYIFANWTENGNVISRDAQFSFPIYEDKLLTAHFLVKPTPPKALKAGSVTQVDFIANWELVDGMMGYYLDVSLDNQFKNTLSRYNSIDVGNVNSFPVTSLVSSVLYYYRVRSYNTAGISDFSNIISVNTLKNKPSVPIAKTASSISQTGFTANWDTVDNADGYYIDVAIDPYFNNKVTRFDNLDVGKTISFEITGLTENLTYYFRVRAYNTGGASENSNTISVLLTDIEDLNYPTDYQLYQNFPNPFNPSTQIRFTLPHTTWVKLSIYNLLGQEIKELVNKELSPSTYAFDFDASELESGIYFYRIQTNDFLQTRKMILMK